MPLVWTLKLKDELPVAGARELAERLRKLAAELTRRAPRWRFDILVPGHRATFLGSDLRVS